MNISPSYYCMCLALLSSLLLAGMQAANAQQPFGWDVLADVKFQKTFDKEYGIEKVEASFGQGPLAYEGREVEIKGYVIPVRLSQGLYFLSRFPNYACFFCQQAGPETVIELRTRRGSNGKPPAFAMDDYLTFRGRLRLNAKDFKYTSYILEDAVATGNGR